MKFRIKKETTDSGKEKYYVQYSRLGIFWKYIENRIYYGGYTKIAIFKMFIATTCIFDFKRAVF